MTSWISYFKTDFSTLFDLHKFVTLLFGIFGVAAMIEQLMGHVWQLHCTYASAYSVDIMMAEAYAAYEASTKIL